MELCFQRLERWEWIPAPQLSGHTAAHGIIQVQVLPTQDMASASTEVHQCLRTASASKGKVLPHVLRPIIRLLALSLYKKSFRWLNWDATEHKGNLPLIIHPFEDYHWEWMQRWSFYLYTPWEVLGPKYSAWLAVKVILHTLHVKSVVLLFSKSLSVISLSIQDLEIKLPKTSFNTNAKNIWNFSLSIDTQLLGSSLSHVAREALSIQNISICGSI